MKKINIAKYASGSWPDNIGDTTLFYTSDTSRHARDVAGLFLDNPPVLSPNHASLVWRYYQDVDKYILIHVQGSHVVSAALGRNYPFRAGYEVSREEMNNIDFNLFSLFEAFPKISEMPSGRINLEDEIDNSRYPQNIWIDDNLARCIQEAVLSGKQIYIEQQEIKGDIYKNDGIFGASELKVLQATIFNLPIDIRRYVTFAIGVDHHFLSVLDGVTVILYIKGSDMTIPRDAIHFSWGQTPSYSTSQLPLNITLPGENEKLWSPEELVNALRIQKRIDKGYDSFDKEDWKFWLAQKHSLSELRTNSWKTFEKYYQKMDDKTKAEYIKAVHRSSITWDINDLSSVNFELMNYEPDLIFILQCNALSSFLASKGSKFKFLFPKGQIPKEVLKTIDANFIKTLNLSKSEDIIKWYEIIEENNCMSKDIQIQLSELFKAYVAPLIHSLDKTIYYMKKYPRILSSSYLKPESMTGVSQKDIKALDKAHQEVISIWWNETVKAYQATDFRNDVIFILDGVCGIRENRDSLKEAFLKDIDPDYLYRLIVEGGEVLWKCEALLTEITSKLLPKEWKNFAVNKALPTVLTVMFDEQKGKPFFSLEYLSDIRNWFDIVNKYKDDYPLIFHLIEQQLDKILKTDTHDDLFSRIEETFIEKSDDKEIKYTDKAETSYPLIKRYIMTIKKDNPSKAEEMETIFKDLQCVKNKNKHDHKLKRIFGLGGVICGIIISMLLFFLYLWFLPSKDENAIVSTEGVTISFLDETGKNPMLKIANVGLKNIKDVCKITIDSSTYSNIPLNNIDSLRHINLEYYKNLPKEHIIHNAIVDIYTINEKGDSTGMGHVRCNINRQTPLLSIYESIQWRLEQITVINNEESIKITIPNDSLANDTDGILSMRDAKYYYNIIKYVDSNLPKEKELNIAY